MRIKFSILQMMYWCGYGAFAAYLVPYLNSQGFSSSVVGTVMSVYTLIAMLGQMLYGQISDYIKSIKKIYLFNHFLIIACILIIFFSALKYKIYFVCLLGFIQLPMPVLLDSWIIKYYSKTPDKYAPIRSFGSLSYALFSLIFGCMIEKIGFISMPVCSIIFFSISFIVSLLTVETTINLKDKNTINFGSIIKNSQILVMTIINLLLGLSAGTIMNMQSYIVYGIGGLESSIGVCMSISAFVQVPVMMFYSKIKMNSSKKSIAIAIVMYIISFLIMYIASNITLLYLSMILYGIGYAYFLSAIREYVSKNIDMSIQTTALSIFDSFQNCLGSSLGILFGGILIAKYSEKIMILMCLIFIIIALIINIGNSKKINM